MARSSKDCNVEDRQTAAEKHASAIVQGLVRKEGLVNAVAFLKNLEMGGGVVGRPWYNCLLEALVGCGDTDGAL